jgi:hypothetical protein
MNIHRKHRVGRITSGAAAAALLPLLLAPAAQAQAAPWTVVPSANANTGNNVLAAVTSVVASDVWAVGNFTTATGATQALTEHWDGTAWSLVPSPSVLESSLLGTAGVSATDVWAVGSFLTSGSVEQALFEHWNGRKWVQAKSPATPAGTVMRGVAAVSASDIWAVGSSLNATSVSQTLIEQFNGRKWSVVPSPDASTQNNRLDAVTAVAANDVWAVGTAQTASGVFQTLTEHWDGAAWSIVASPAGTQAELDTAAAVSSNDVWAVGTAQTASGVFQTLTEHWDGAAWSIVASPAGTQAELDSAAAVSSNDVWAAGHSGSATLIEHWNGTSWAVVPSPSPGPLFNVLNGIAVVAANDIWAVGSSQNSSGISATLIEQWNGTSWSVVTSPSPGSAASLSGAAANPVSGQAWAVGNFTAASGAQQTLTEFNP